MRLVGIEEVEVARAEDDGVEDLGDERDALRGAVPVDCEDEDYFGEEVAYVCQVAEDLAFC